MRCGSRLLSATQPRDTFITTISTSVEKLGRSILDFILPLRCAGCDKLGDWICAECLSKFGLVESFDCVVCGHASLSGITHPRCLGRYTLDRLISLYQFEGPVRRAVHLLKYRDVTGLAEILSDLMVGEMQNLGIEFGFEAIIVPVPLHWKRAWKRGFNQAELLALSLSRHLALKVRTDLLRRTRDTLPQIELRRSERRQNVSGAFVVPPPKKLEVQGKDFLVVDDVCTTGATLNACASALKRGGARYVWGLTLARD